MPFVQAKCTNCGANLEVNNEHDAAVCPYCHTPFIVEKAINNYITNNVTNIDHLHTDVVNITDSSSADNLAKSGTTFISLGDYSSAQKRFIEMMEKYPYDYRGWLGQIAVESKTFSNTDVSLAKINHMKELYKKACTIVPPDSRNVTFDHAEEYLQAVDSALKSKKDDWNKRLSCLEREIKHIEEEHQNKQNMLECQLKELKAHKPVQRSAIWLIILFIFDILLVVAGGIGGALGPSIGCVFFIFGPIEAFVLQLLDGKKSPYSKWESEISNLEGQIDSAKESCRRMISPLIDEMSHIEEQRIFYLNEERK